MVRLKTSMWLKTHGIWGQLVVCLHHKTLKTVFSIPSILNSEILYTANTANKNVLITQSVQPENVYWQHRLFLHK